MSKRPMRWPAGTGQWSRLHTIVVSGDEHHRTLLRSRARPDTLVVGTPLDVIARLEDDAQSVATVVLAGSFAEGGELGAFLREFYPSLEVIDGREDEAYFPAFA